MGFGLNHPLALTRPGGMVGLVGDIIVDGISRMTDVHAMGEMKDSAILAKQQIKHVVHVASKHLDQLKT